MKSLQVYRSSREAKGAPRACLAEGRPGPIICDAATHLPAASLQVEKGMRDTATEVFTVLDRIGGAPSGDDGGGSARAES